MTATPSTRIIIAGHSHTSALLGFLGDIGEGPGKPRLQPAVGHETIFGLYGAWPRNEEYWDALVHHSPGHSIALLWEGNHHNGLFLIEQPSPFDFIPRRLQSFPVQKGAVLVPEALVRAKFRSLLAPLGDMLAFLKARTSSPIAVVGTPPPKGDDAKIREMFHEYSEYLEYTGTTVEQIKLTLPIIRLKLWTVLQDLYQEEAERNGVKFIPVPEYGIADETGFLKPECWAPDATHANPAYGQVMIEQLVRQFG